MKVSSTPISAWNLIGDQIQVATPIASATVLHRDPCVGSPGLRVIERLPRGLCELLGIERHDPISASFAGAFCER